MKEEFEIKNENKRNFTFDLLYVLAIIMVVDVHVLCPINILTNLFPYDSFFMPLFVFAAGYFFKRQSILKNIKHKVKKLLVPLTIWNIVMFNIGLLIDNIFGTSWTFTQNFFLTFFWGTLTQLNGAAWFVIMLFWVSIAYNIIRNIFKKSKANDLILTICFIWAGFIAVYLAINGVYKIGWYWSAILNFLFYIQFYHLGYIFKNYIEDKLNNKNKILILASCIIINLILVLMFKEQIKFGNTRVMSGFFKWYLPIITSITGILFWYIIMSYLASKIKENRYITFVAKNTFTIMESHLLFANFVSIICYILYCKGVPYFEKFDVKRFLATPWAAQAWERVNPSIGLVAFFVSITLSILLALIIDKFKNAIKEVHKSY